ncbi:MAG: hypothetical protein ACKO3P_09480, partial [Planctomycetaceae bacterium]
MSPALPFAARHHRSGRTMPCGATVAKRRGPRMAIGQAWRWIALAWMCGAGWVGSSLAVAQGLSPREAISKMKLPPGWQVEVVASEPLARQPVAIDFDDRGRLWVLQYLQYPNPEGLQRVQVDRFSRTRYDRVPEPPPKGPRGADRLTIVTDSNGDGVADEARDFIDGL